MLKYRPDIDGLRALAIIPVVWFHSDLPGLPGGFTGVDTFFVISGFLISAIIHREVQAGTFTFGSFYERRMRRIGPALIFTVSVTLAVGSVMLLPHELEALAKSAIAALLMVPNIHFWSEAGYFRLGDSITPLLHTWSLGVEEQFYLLFPIALILAQRLRGRSGFDTHRWLVTGIALASLALCLYATSRWPSASFYLLPTRAWELMAGALIAVGVIRLPQSLGTPASLLGLALLGAAAALINERDLFPGYLAIVPVAGAALIIAAGEGAAGNRVLAARPLVWLGKRSYSLYLWHWPVFVFLRDWSGELSPMMAAAGMTLSIGLTAISYRFVEQPFRRKLNFRAVAGATGAGAASIAAVAAIMLIGNGLPQRIPPNAITAIAVKDDLPPFAHACVNVPVERAWADCRVGTGTPSVAVWGDSHAAATGAAIAEGLDQAAVILSANTCAPTERWVSSGRKGAEADRCRSRNKAIADALIADASIRTVVLSSYWASYDAETGGSFWQSVQPQIDALRASGKAVYILAGIPSAGVNVPRAAAIAIMRNEKPPSLNCPPPPLRRFL